MIGTLEGRERELLLDEFKAIRPQAAGAIALFDEGATLPFIARYRKEKTGGLTETQLKEIQDRLAFHAGLLERKATILESIREQKALTPDLERTIVECTDRRRLEDLYLPYKPKRRTRAEVAREKGFGPLAEAIWAHRPASGSPEAIAGASDILAERISEQASTREWIRRETLGRGRLSSRKKRGAPSDRSKFEMYFDFTQLLSRIASHQALAVFRGETEGVLSVSIDVEPGPILAYLDRLYHRPQSPHAKLFRAIEADAYERLLAPSIQNEIRAIIRERA
ncbi:MAG TPA: Tex-like N-terminal domain-containing protein, partial [Planctomycetota bacterium]|nr:Tex-like N-terminal domain-containing protein [Planctomycetota bacterium]